MKPAWLFPGCSGFYSSTAPAWCGLLVDRGTRSSTACACTPPPGARLPQTPATKQCGVAGWCAWQAHSSLLASAVAVSAVPVAFSCRLLLQMPSACTAVCTASGLSRCAVHHQWWVPSQWWGCPPWQQRGGALASSHAFPVLVHEGVLSVVQEGRQQLEQGVPGSAGMWAA